MEHPSARSASWLSSVLEASLSGVLAFEPLPGASGEPTEYRVTFANGAAGELIGTTPTLVVGNTLGNLFPNDAILRVHFDRVVTRGEAQRFEFEHLNPARPGAGRTWFDASVNRLDDGVVMSFIDVTATRQVESQAEKTIARLHSILDGSPAAIGLLEAVRDPENPGRIADFTIVSLNEQFCSLMKYEPADLIGRRFKKLFKRSLTAKLYDRFVRVVQTGVPLHEELHLERGPLLGWFDLTAVRQGDGLTITVLDVTDYREAEEKAQQTARMLETVLDRAQAGVTWHHAVRNEAGDIEDFRVVAINEASAQLFARVNPALRGQTLTGRRLSQFFPQAWDLGLFDRFVNVVETGEPVRYERTYPSDDGGELWFDVSAVKEDDGLILTFVDITRSKEAELEAEATAELLGGVFDASPWAIVYLAPEYDADGDVVDFTFQLANARSEGIGQRPLPNLIGGRMLDMYPRTRDLGLFEEYVRVLETGKPFEREVFFQQGDIAVWSHITAVKQGDGLVLTNSDITARKLAELQNEESLRLLQGVLASAPTAIFWIEAVRDADQPERIVDFSFTLFNAHTVGLTHRPAAELHAQRLRHLFPHLENTGLFDDYVRVVETGEPLQRDVFYDWDGVSGWFNVQAARHDDGVVVQVLDVTERKRAEQEVLRLKDKLAQRAEDRYQTLFTAMNQGFCLLETVGTAAGAAGDQPGDFRYLAANPAFERHTGLRDVVGKTIREVVPDAEPGLMDLYDEVALTGQHRHTEAYVPALDLWMEAEVFPAPEPGQIAVLFTNVTARKKHEERLRRAAAMDAFRVKLSDALRPLADVTEILATVTNLVMEHYGADRCYYCEIEDGNAVILRDAKRGDLPSVAGVYPLADFPLFQKMMNDGAPLVVPDAAATDRMDESLKQLCIQSSVISFINIPVLKEGHYRGNLCIARSTPGDWNEDDVTMAQETAERTWAAVERAQAEAALRESEARLQLALDAADLGTFSWFVAEDRTIADARALAHFGFAPDAAATLSESLARIFHPEDGPRYVEAIGRAIDPTGPGTLHQEFRIRRADGERWMSVTAMTVFEGNPPTAKRITGVLADITGRRRQEEALRRAAEMDAFRVGLADALRPLADPLLIQQTALQFAAGQLNLDRLLYNEIDADVTTYTTRACYVREGFTAYGGAHPMGPFTESVRALQEGITKVVYDVQADESFSPEEKRICASIQVGAFVTVPLLKAGRWVLNLVAHSSKPRPWSPQEISLLEETAERTWAAVERAQAEEALRESEAKYRTLFDSIDEGYCLVETIFDEAGKAVDFRYLETNPVFDRQTGQVSIVGKRASETAPQTESVWFETLGEVARTGTPLRFENFHADTGRWYAGYASRVGGAGSTLLTLVFDDITERKRREANLALLAEIAGDLSRLAAPDEIMQSVGARLGEFLHVSSCIFADVDEAKNEAVIHHGWNTANVPSLKQTFRLADYFGEEFRRAGRAGETIAVSDTATDERANAEAYAKLKLGAFVTVPFQKQGRWTANITVTSQDARDWRADEIELLQEIASRIFPRIERARAEAALRESEERLRLLVESATDYSIFHAGR